jgi:hypothetical protein
VRCFGTFTSALESLAIVVFLDLFFLTVGNPAFVLNSVAASAFSSRTKQQTQINCVIR